MSSSLNPDFPIVSGDYQLGKGWRVALPEQFNRRIEDGSLVLWMPELTFWFNAWNNDLKASVEEQLNLILQHVSAERREEKIERAPELARLSYEVTEQDPENAGSSIDSISAYVIGPQGYLQISAYGDSPEARTLAYKIIASIRT
jgi:hypothetical protein